MAPSTSAAAHDDRDDRNDRCLRNRRALTARAGCRTARQRLHWRNSVVQDNLPLVYAMAARLRHGSDIPLEDLAQVGSLGLIRAVEAFDPSRRVQLSSFAVPYVRGAILHEIRDRGCLVRIPRRLWDLRQQVSSLQATRRRDGLPPHDQQELQGAVGCDAEQLQEIDTLWSVTAMRSLDAPEAGGDRGAGHPETLLERLAAPESEPPAEPGRSDTQRQWLAWALDQLTPERRALLQDRISLNCSWVELGQRHGISARQAQRQVVAGFETLRRLAADAGLR